MSFANPLGLLALLSLPVIVAIHLYHRRFPPLPIAGAHLWGAETQVRSPGRRRERLPITTSLLLELLAALLISLALSQPRLGDWDRVNHLVVVLDDSASMNSAGPDGQTMREAAIGELSARVGRLGRRSRITLILTGRRPVMLAGPAAEWDDARTALAGWKPSAVQHNFDNAWDLAAQLADESGRLLFLTDRLPGEDVPLPRRMEVVSVGANCDNVAISAARWTFDSTANVGRVFLRVANLGRQAVDCTISGLTPERTVFQKSLSIEGGAETPLQTEVPGGLGRLTLVLTADGDGLSLDNSVTLIEPKVRTLTVALALPAQSTAAGVLQRALAGIADIQTGSAESAHLVFGPAAAQPPSSPEAWWFGIGPLDSADEAMQAASHLIGPYLLEKQNPLLEGITLDGVIWGGVQPVGVPATPIISAGRSLLLSRLNATNGNTFLLNIDLDRSNLTDSPDWPILIQNLAELRRDSLPGLRRFNYRLDEEIRFRLYEGLPAAGDEEATGPLSLVHGERTRPLARTSLVELPPLDQTGVYEIRDGERTLGEFAVNFFDAEESDLKQLAPGIRSPLEPTVAAGFVIDDAYTWILVLAIAMILLALLLDWRVLQKGG